MRIHTGNEYRYREKAKECLMKIFEENPENIFYTNQLAVIHERQFFHWITSHALSDLKEENKIGMCEEVIDSRSYFFYFNKKFRYYKRSLKSMTQIIERLYNSQTSHTIGSHLEQLVTTSFFKLGFHYKGVHTNELNGIKWSKTNHNLDFIVEKDGITYGVECKNTIPYIDKKEFDTKIELCEHLGIKPIFAVRYLPTSWVKELYEKGGFAWIFQYQLYPKYLIRDLQEIEQALKLPLKICEQLWDTTNQRLLSNHNKLLKNM